MLSLVVSGVFHELTYLLQAFSRGYDVIFLSDGAGTTSPKYSQDSIEFNCAKTWGFCMTCTDLAEGVGLQ